MTTVRIIDEAVPVPPPPPDYIPVVAATLDALTGMLAIVQHMAAMSPAQSALTPALAATNMKLQHAKGMLGAIRSS